GRGRRLRRQCCGGAGGYNHSYAAADEIGSKRRQPIILIFRPPVFNRHVLALDIAGFLQTPKKRNGDVLVVIISGLRAEETDHRQRWLLRPPHHRPRRRAPEPGNELPAFHSTTSSALTRSVFGISKPRVFAVIRLITKSYLVGICTGRSAGFSPFKMRST